MRRHVASTKSSPCTKHRDPAGSGTGAQERPGSSCNVATSRPSPALVVRRGSFSTFPMFLKNLYLYHAGTGWRFFTRLTVINPQNPALLDNADVGILYTKERK